VLRTCFPALHCALLRWLPLLAAVRFQQSARLSGTFKTEQDGARSSAPACMPDSSPTRSTAFHRTRLCLRCRCTNRLASIHTPSTRTVNNDSLRV
jgi:hypothetical protein